MEIKKVQKIKQNGPFEHPPIKQMEYTRHTYIHTLKQIHI